MKLTIATSLGLCLAGLAAWGQGFEADGKSFTLRRGQELIRVSPPGAWTAGIQGGPALSWHLFLWHGNYLYEAQSGGTVTAGPTVAPDGSVSWSGAFFQKEGVPPVKYSQQVTATPEGVEVRCELEKTGELPLNDGVQLAIGLPKEMLHGPLRAYVRPEAHGLLGSPVSGVCDKLFLELAGGRCLTFGGPGYRPARLSIWQDSYSYQVRLTPKDFPVGQKTVFTWTVGFDNLPATFPGDITARRDKLALRGATPSATRLDRYGKLELTVDLGATYDNPFDPDDVALDATFVAPSGRESRLPGFLMVDQKREASDLGEILIPQGAPRWVVRFAPQEVGRYRYRLALRDRTGTVTGGEGTFESVAGQAKGFVRASKPDPHYFAFDNGEGFLAIGHNLPEYHQGGQTGEDAMRKFAAAKENYNRWWLTQQNLGVEWADRLGWYLQAPAWRVDHVLDLAEELGLYYMMCFDTHQDFLEGRWKTNPYNKEAGGPCATVADWFTNQDARKWYKKRLRYIVARWGYSPHILCWEFGNEFEGWQAPQEAKLAWHKEMAPYLKSLDPFGHLVTTSWWGHTGPPEFWALPDIDIVQTHLYTNNDANVAETVRDFCLQQHEQFAKPHVFGEFGIRSHSTTADKDPEGWGLHNALWAGMASFAAGGPMPWWHENYIDPLNLYFHFTAIANFTRDLPFGTRKWTALEYDPPEFVNPKEQPQVRDVVIEPTAGWGKPPSNEFTVSPDGDLTNKKDLNPLLHGQGHTDLKSPPTFLVNYPQPGKFIAHVDRVSNSGLLRVWVDDELKLEREFPCAEGLGKESVWREQWKLWETVYDQDITLDIPAGQHRIKLDNDGKDWMRIPRYVFTGCQLITRPYLLVAGMKSDDVAVLWLQNRNSDWFNHASGKPIAPAAPTRLRLKGLKDGPYTIEWWETWKGSPARTERVQARDGVLGLRLPELAADTAAKIRKG